MQIQSLKKVSKNNKSLATNSIVGSESKPKTNLKSENDKLSFGLNATKLAKGECYAQQVKEMLSTPIYIEDKFNEVLLKPVEEYLAEQGLAIKVKKVKSPNSSWEDDFSGSVSKYKAALIPHGNGKDSALKDEALDFMRLSHKTPDVFVDLTPNLAKIKLLTLFEPKIQSPEMTTRVGLMTLTREKIYDAMEQAGLNNFFTPGMMETQMKREFGGNKPNLNSELDPSDVQHVFSKLLPEITV